MKNYNSPLNRRPLHKWRIFMEFTLSLSYTSSRAANRRGDPESLDLPLRGRKAREYYNGFVTMFLATTGYAKVSLNRGEFWKTVEKSNPPNPLRGRGSRFPLFKGGQGILIFSFSSQERKIIKNPLMQSSPKQVGSWGVSFYNLRHIIPLNSRIVSAGVFKIANQRMGSQHRSFFNFEKL